MNKEILSQKTGKNLGMIKNYCTIAGMQLMLTILGGCESSIIDNQETKKNDIEINDTIDIEQLAFTYDTIANTAFEEQNQTIAIPNYIKALEYYQQMGNQKRVQIITKNIALGYYQQGNYPKYLEYIQKALKLAKEINYEYGIRFANASLGGYHYEIKNQPEIALNKFYLPGQEALKKITNEEDRKELEVKYINGIAECYMTMEEYNQAEKYRNLAEEKNKEIKDTMTEIGIYYNKGILLENKKKYKEAEKKFIHGLDLSNQKNTNVTIKNGYKNLANLYEETGEYKKAYEYRTEENKLAQEINNETSSRTQIELETNIKDKQLIQQKAEIIQKNEREKTLEEQKEKILRTAIMSILTALSLGGAVYFKSKKNKLEKKKNEEISHQKELVEETNHQLEEKNAEVEAVNNKLEEANGELAEKNKNITDSINYAKRIQEGFLQHPEKLKGLFPKSFVFFKPKDIVSGDFYRFYETPGGKKIIIVADCTGHGVPGAFLTFIGNNILDDIIIKQGEENPGKILDHLNKEIRRQLKGNEYLSGEEIKDSMDIALFSYDSKTGEFESAGAKNKIYISSQGEFTETKADSKLIGQHNDEFKYKTEIHHIQPGSTIYLGTDGLADQFGGKKNKKIKSRRVRDLITSLQKTQRIEGEDTPRILTMEEQRDRIEKYFNERKGDTEQTDDVLLIGIQV